MAPCHYWRAECLGSRLPDGTSRPPHCRRAAALHAAHPTRQQRHHALGASLRLCRSNWAADKSAWLVTLPRLRGFRLPVAGGIGTRLTRILASSDGAPGRTRGKNVGVVAKTRRVARGVSCRLSGRSVQAGGRPRDEAYEGTSWIPPPHKGTVRGVSRRLSRETVHGRGTRNETTSGWAHLSRGVATRLAVVPRPAWMASSGCPILLRQRRKGH